MNAGLKGFPPQPMREMIAGYVAQSIPNAAWTMITGYIVFLRGVNSHNHAGNPLTTGKLFAPKDGFYLIAGTVAFAANATGIRQVRLNLNSTPAAILAGQSAPGHVSEITWLNVAMPYYLYRGETVEAQVYQNCGVALSLASLSGVYTSVLSLTELP